MLPITMANEKNNNNKLWNNCGNEIEKKNMNMGKFQKKLNTNINKIC